jgi:hypothetical protein
MDVKSTLQDPSTSPNFENLPYHIGEFTYTLILTSSACADWTETPPDEVYNLPQITRDISTSVYTGSFNVLNWVYSTNTDMEWTATGVSTDLSANIYSSWEILPEWTIRSQPAWITEHVYDLGGNEMTNPDTWQNGYKLILIPSVNTGSSRSGTVDISVGNSGLLSINVSQDAALVQPTVSVTTGEAWNITNDTGSIIIGTTLLYFEFDHDYEGDTWYPTTIIDADENVVYNNLSDIRIRGSEPNIDTYREISRAAVSGDVFTIYVGSIPI